jgi:hypothetical protein
MTMMEEANNWRILADVGAFSQFKKPPGMALAAASTMKGLLAHWSRLSIKSAAHQC